MRLAKLIPAFAVLASLSAPLLAQEWAGHGRIQGTIKDETGKAVWYNAQGDQSTLGSQSWPLWRHHWSVDRIDNTTVVGSSAR